MTRKKKVAESKWVEVAPGRMRLVTPEMVAREKKRQQLQKKGAGYTLYTNGFCDGSGPEEERYRRLYGQKMVVCEDLKDKRARTAWPRYQILPDGREGPLPFKSKAERKSYCAAFGFRESGDWS